MTRERNVEAERKYELSGKRPGVYVGTRLSDEQVAWLDSRRAPEESRSATIKRLALPTEIEGAAEGPDEVDFGLIHKVVEGKKARSAIPTGMLRAILKDWLEHTTGEDLV
jgi:hypothetical protein